MKNVNDRDDWDDGRVIAPMNGDELPFYRRIGRKLQVKSDLTKKEKRSMTRGLFAVMLPQLLIVLLGFAVTACLLALWLG